MEDERSASQHQEKEKEDIMDLVNAVDGDVGYRATGTPTASLTAYLTANIVGKKRSSMSSFIERARKNRLGATGVKILTPSMSSC